jgi:putative transposase
MERQLILPLTQCLEMGEREPGRVALPDGPNQRWSLDFVSDSLICGRRFRILCVVDD